MTFAIIKGPGARKKIASLRVPSHEWAEPKPKLLWGACPSPTTKWTNPKDMIGKIQLAHTHRQLPANDVEEAGCPCAHDPLAPGAIFTNLWWGCFHWSLLSDTVIETNYMAQLDMGPIACWMIGVFEPFSNVLRGQYAILPPLSNLSRWEWWSTFNRGLHWNSYLRNTLVCPHQGPKRCTAIFMYFWWRLVKCKSPHKVM